MKKLIFLCALLAIVGIAQAEMLVNGGFEDSDTSFAPWLVWGSGGGGYGMENYSWTSTWGADIYTGTLHTSGGSGGGNWLEVGLAGTNISTWAWGYNVTFQGKTPDGQTAMPVTIGEYLTMSADYKSSSATSAMLGWEWCNDSGTMVDLNGDGTVNDLDKVNYMLPLVADGSWQNLEVTVQVPNVAGLVQLIAVFGGAGAGQDLGLDNGSVIPEPISIALFGLGGLFLRRRK